jgi:uncharacterized protein
MTGKTIANKILHFPLTRIIIGIATIALVIAICYSILDHIPENSFYKTDWENLIYSIVIAGATLIAYATLFRYYEKRKIKELSLRKFGRSIFIGSAFGIGLFSLIIFTIFIFGGYKIDSWNSIRYLLPGFSVGIFSGVTEEVICRGILFRITEEKLGSVIALIISSLLFGLAHLSNPGGSLFVAICIAIEAGLTIGMSYVYTRNLWMPVALHFGWNFAEGGIYGTPVSGYVFDKTLVTSHLQGSQLLTGGEFGPEGSLPCLIFGSAAAVLLFILCKKENKLIKPFWAKTNQAEIPGNLQEEMQESTMSPETIISSPDQNSHNSLV